MAAAPTVVTQPGRRPVIDYVTKDYEGFRQAMLSQIPLLLPNWTDRSESDFGIVLLELFAYVADILSYYQDRIANEAYLDTATQRRSITQLLRLIGYQIDPGLAASTLIHFDATADVSVSGASLPYRLKTAGIAGQPDRIFEITQPFTLKLANSGIDVSSASSIPAGATAILIPTASHALDRDSLVYFEEKTTGGGAITIRRSAPLKITSVSTVTPGTDSIAWLPPLSESYSPASTLLKGNNVTATHGETFAGEPVFIGDGTPDQKMVLSRAPLTHLLKSGPLQRRRSSPELIVRVDGVLWQEVDNFFESLPPDTHYTVSIDENDVLTVQFGTGERGAVPPAGAKITAVYRLGLGSQGNVGPDTLSVPVTSVPQVKAITNPYSASGGSDRETEDEARISGPGSIITQERAVTLQDYELLAKAFPGVGKAKARVGLRGGYKVVQVFLVPENPGAIPPPPPSDDLRDSLKQYLEARQPVNRMAGVDVLNPSYVAVDISVDVNVQAQASATQVSQRVGDTLASLLSFAAQDFGRPVRVGEVYSALYPISGVAYVILRRLARADGLGPVATACEFADIPIAENEFPFQGRLTVNVFGGVA